MPFRYNESGQKVFINSMTGQPVQTPGETAPQMTQMDKPIQNNVQDTGFNFGNFVKSIKWGVPGFGGVSANDLKGKTVGGYVKNAGQDAMNIIKGLVSLPGIAKSVMSGEIKAEDLAANVAGSLAKDYVDLATDPLNTTYNKPVTSVLNVLPFTQVGKGAEASTLVENTAQKPSILERGLEAVSENAASKMTRASPAAFKTALENGIDVNKTLAKYLPEQTFETATVKDFVGDIAKGGKGGIIRNNIDDAEKVIQAAVKGHKGALITTDELLQPLIEQRVKLASVPGNQSKLAVIDDFIEETKKLYPKGLNAEQSLNLKRVFDDAFGKAVADDTKGAAAASSQKILANRARELLKERLSEVKDALDKESELYTLRPILEQSYAVEKTQGALIRRGGISALDLTKPITFVDVVTSNPKVASLLAKAQRLNEAIPELKIPGLGKASLMGPAVTSMGKQGINNGQNTTENNVENGNNKGNDNQANNINGQIEQNNINNDMEQQGNRNPIIPPAEPDSVNPFGNLTKKQVLTLALSQGAKKKDLDEIGAIYDMVTEQSGIASEDMQKSASSLRTEYLAQTKNNGYFEAVNSYNKLRKVPDTAAGDVSMIYSYMKMLDPGSVVRETEQSIAQNATSLPGKFQNYVAQVTSGKRLNPEQRQEFLDAAKELFGSVKATQDEIDTFYEGLAKDYGVEPRLIGIKRIGNSANN